MALTSGSGNLSRVAVPYFTEKLEYCRFFDYFSVSGQFVDIYVNDRHVSDFYSGKDRQTLDVRYQVLMLLQYLMEAYIHAFYRECTRILQSDDFRFYFQCCIFDVLGQLENPDGEAWKFLKVYFYDEKWRAYIFRTVFFGHPPFVRLLFEGDKDFPWSEGEGRVLLRSIMEQGSDLAIDILEETGIGRFATEDLFDILRADQNCKSEKGFELRKQLIRNHSELLRNDFDIYRMIEQELPQAVDMLLILLETAPEIRETLYLPEGKKLQSFAERNAALIFEKLGPAVLKKADQEFDKKYPWRNIWFNQSLRVSCERGLVSIVQTACSWMAENEPESFLVHINEAHERFALETEIVLHAMEKLPVSYADAALEWLVSDFESHAFDKTSGEKTKLSACQRVIQRFSGNCDETLFRRLENLICGWMPPIDDMRWIMKRRLELRKEGDWITFPEYWGDLQIMLLPALDPQRTSRDAKALLAVLERKFPNGTGLYNNDPMSMAHFVSSPIEEHVNKLSNRSWLGLIRSFGRVKEGRSNWARGFDTSPDLFAQSLYSAAKEDPVRFAKLSLRFPQNTYDGFCREIVRACESKDVPMELACEVLRKFCCNPSRNMAIAFSRTINERADEDWPEDIMEMLIDIARNNPDPKDDSYPVHRMDADRDTICNDLWQSSINCARGCALHAISDLIWQHSEKQEWFADILRTSVEDANPAVCFAAMRCVYAWYNIDRALTKELFDELVEREPRTLYMQEAGQLIIQFYDDDRDKYRALLLATVDSPITELRPKAARLMAALAMRDDWMLEQMLAMSLDEQKIRAISDEAIWMFKSESYHALGKRILLHLIEHKAAIHNIMMLTPDHLLKLDEDKDILEKLIFFGDAHILTQVLRYIYETEGYITDYIDVFASYIQNNMQSINHYFELEPLAKCTARAFRQGKEDAHIRDACLDIWDALFERFPLEMKVLSEKME